MKLNILVNKQFVFLSVLLGLCCQGGIAGGAHSTTKSNLDVMQNLAGLITKDIIDSCNISEKDSIAVRFASSNDSWIVQNTALEMFKNYGCTVFTGSDSVSMSGITIQCSGVTSKVQYTDAFTDGLFGTKKMKRSVSVGCSCNAVKTRSDEVLYSQMLMKQSIDTVNVDDIQEIETASVSSTHGELPPESFLDRIVEPFVIIGTTGVAIYLFFHVRG